MDSKVPIEIRLAGLASSWERASAVSVRPAETEHAAPEAVPAERRVVGMAVLLTSWVAFRLRVPDEAENDQIVSAMKLRTATE
jgi:hypothetical protein